MKTALYALLFWVISTTTAFATQVPKGAVVGWEIALWVTGGIAGLIGAIKLIEWTLQSSGVWIKPTTKILERQEILLIELRNLNARLSSFLDRWSASESHIAELQKLHYTKLGERPAWWCAIREQQFEQRQAAEERAHDKLIALVTGLCDNEDKQLKLLRAVLSRLKGEKGERVAIEEEEL